MNWFYVILAYSSLFALGMSDTARGVLYPQILEIWDVSKSEGALFFVLASLAGLIAMLTTKWWLGRLGLLKSLQVLVLLMLLSLVGMTQAAEKGLAFTWLLFFAALYGVSLNALGIVVNLLAIEGSAPDKKSRVLSGLHAFYGLSSLLAPLIVSHWFESSLFSFQYLAILPLGVWLGSLFVGGKTTSAVPPVNERSACIDQSSNNPGGWGVPIALGLYVGAELSLSSRMTLLLQDWYGLSGEASGYYLSAFFFCLMLGRFLGIFKVGKKERVFTWINYLFLASTISFVLGLLLHPVFLSLTGLMMSLIFPWMISYTEDFYPNFSEQIIVRSMTCVGGFLVVFHLGVGQIADVYGVRNSLWVGPIGLLVSLIFFYYQEKVRLQFDLRGGNSKKLEGNS